jgi:hypothetical protein
MGANGRDTVIAAPLPAFAGKHYSAQEVAELWGLSTDYVRRLFENEPGVLVLEAPRAYGRQRRYRTLRIPESVVERVHRRLVLKGNGRAA